MCIQQCSCDAYDRKEVEEKDEMAAIELNKKELAEKEYGVDSVIKEIYHELDSLRKRREEIEKEKKDLEMKEFRLESQLLNAVEEREIQRKEDNSILEFLGRRTKISERKVEQIQEQLKAVRKDLQKAEGGEKVNELEAFMDRQISELESELECPVCFKLAKTAPIFKCSDDHLICR